MTAPASTRTSSTRRAARATAGSAGKGGATGAFTGARALIRLALRRDRIIIPVWLAVFTTVAASTASSTLAVFPDEATRRGMAVTVNSTPTLLALYGRIFDETSAGAVALFKVGALGAALVAVLAVVLVVRHTRAEEEAGRLELLGAGVLGRYATLTAALVVVAGTMLLLAALTAAALAAGGLPVIGSIAFGLSWALTGICFAAVAAIAAQLAKAARGATGLSVALLGVTYLLRAIGDAADRDGPRWASWLSPVGWAQQLRPFAGERWWVLVVPTVFCVLATTCAYVLAGRRDLGAGVLPDRPGAAHAGRWLASPTALAVRLQRGTLLAWTAAYALLGWVLGGIATTISTALDSPAARQMIARLGGQEEMVNAYLATEMGAVGMITSAFAVQAMLRLRAEESARHADPLLATALTRRRWAISHLLVAVGGSLWLLIVAGFAGGVSVAVSTGDGARVGQVLAGALVQLPAVAVLIGIVLALTGLAPRATMLGWAALVAFLLIGEIGPLLQLDQRILDLSPYSHLPKVPGHEITATPLVWLTALAIALIVAGVEGFRRRDLD